MYVHKIQYIYTHTHTRYRTPSPSAAPLRFVDQARKIRIFLWTPLLSILRFSKYISETLVFVYCVTEIGNSAVIYCSLQFFRSQTVLFSVTDIKIKGTNLGYLVVRVTKFCTVAPNIFNVIIVLFLSYT
jgi:hypothetical protein